MEENGWTESIQYPDVSILLDDMLKYGKLERRTLSLQELGKIYREKDKSMNYINNLKVPEGVKAELTRGYISV